MEQLENILPLEKKVLFGEETIAIKTFRVKDAALIAKVFNNVLSTIGLAKNIDQSLLLSLIMQTFSENASNIISLVSSCTGISEKELNELNLASMTFLMKHIINENIEFFQSQMLPQIKDLMKSVEEAAPQQETQTGEK